MNVLQLVSRDEPGGVQVLTRMVGDGLAARGHAVDTLALRGAPLQIVRAALSGRYDAILSYQVAAGLAGSLLGWLARVPVRVTHLTALPSAMSPHWRRLDLVFGCVGIHTAIVANSAATAASVAAYPLAYRQRLRLIPHGVAPLPELARDWRAALAIPSTTPLLAASGRLVAQKDHASAVAALAYLPEVHLVIAGEGPLRSALERQAAILGVGDRLHLVGNLERQALASLLGAADIYLFPSIWESFGLAAAEAAMLGLPVVASDLPVLREVLGPAGDMVQFHRVGDATALAGAVSAALKPCPTSAQRTASSAAMRKTHDVAKMIESYCKLLTVFPEGRLIT